MLNAQDDAVNIVEAEARDAHTFRCAKRHRRRARGCRTENNLDVDAHESGAERSALQPLRNRTHRHASHGCAPRGARASALHFARDPLRSERMPIARALDEARYGSVILTRIRRVREATRDDITRRAEPACQDSARRRRRACHTRCGDAGQEALPRCPSRPSGRRVRRRLYRCASSGDCSVLDEGWLRRDRPTRSG